MRGQFLILFVFFSAGCRTPKWAPDHYWSEKRWLVTEIKGDPVHLANTEKSVYMEFNWTDTSFSANAGCNHIRGKYILVDKKGIKFENIIGTKMSCPDIAIENAFLAALHETVEYELEGDKLLFKDDKKRVLVLKKK